ncbi:hypothetical protein K491DRAFT_414728 [Lophiostoma macrostomum CBS 122681]|uniref:Uncharacterized protein n=1 Tax=Lophiostoma macrostomum CBS 122681 TaxID=1314788 RepID=A0A6A6T9W4_9PLEO|nr:hypothetical protein K491DRAFT_414728 [Lophiostoma macrostomum CBS 122681]
MRGLRFSFCRNRQRTSSRCTSNVERFDGKPYHVPFPLAASQAVNINFNIRATQHLSSQTDNNDTSCPWELSFHRVSSHPQQTLRESSPTTPKEPKDKYEQIIPLSLFLPLPIEPGCGTTTAPVASHALAFASAPASPCDNSVLHDHDLALGRCRTVNSSVCCQTAGHIFEGRVEGLYMVNALLETLCVDYRGSTGRSSKYRSVYQIRTLLVLLEKQSSWLRRKRIYQEARVRRGRYVHTEVPKA